MRKRFGDTLVEVTLAIGIFSMVAIAVVTVVNNSTSGAQSSLEVTVTREQIDAQGEALRFVHGSYISDVKAGISSINSNNNSKANYVNLWRKITDRAISQEKITEFIKPSNCNEPYANQLFKKTGFVINTRRLGEIVRNQSNTSGNANIVISDILFTQNDNNTHFRPTVTYPRIVYNDNNNGALGEMDMSNSNLQSAEGLFVIPTIDDKTTTIVTDNGVTKRSSAYYDFYIMSCWYPSNSERPSTISTIVRLYDPDVITSFVK